MSAGFVHLHVHSDYSILDGMCSVKKMLAKCDELNMNACALTDHGNLFGAVDFYMSATKQGIKPIIGSELYVSPTTHTDRNFSSASQAYHHLLLLCETIEGYHNLCKLSSIGYLKGFYYKPRVDDELLATYSNGLIATSACIGGRIPQAILRDDMAAARAAIEKYIGIFGESHFVLELMDHDMPEEKQVNPILVDLANEYGLLYIATNDCHYIDQDDAEAHDALLCVQTQTTLEDEKRFRFPNDSFYFRSPEEMRATFPKWPEALTNTQLLADRCDVELPLNGRLIPSYDPPEGQSKGEYLHALVMQGLNERYGKPPQEYIERAEFELGIIDRMQFLDYFLVVWDLINHARKVGIPVGPGRGSGAGSIVAYTLYITNIDPMRYKLLFERFLNPERVSMPDFDIDFCYNRREEMIQYSNDTYGEDNVSQIITYGRMLAKNVIRNVGRVMGMSYGDVDRIAKLIPDELKITLDKAEEKEPELKQLIAQDSQVATLWRLAKRLEGTIGNCGTHAAGVVICDQPLTDHVALFKASNSDTVATQAEMKCVEEIGLLKMDFLGLRTLTVVHEAVRLLKEGGKVEQDFNIDALEPDDATTYALLRSGQTTGVFQLESSGMRDLAKRIGLQSLEEMSALVALYRPGPMQFIDTYIENKFNQEGIEYEHPLLKPILEESYGIAVYQEQVMQIVQAVAGFSLGQADILRRAMGKKKVDLMAEQREKFVQGCKENDIDAKLAGSLFDKIETFAGYGFNKSHSVAYAFVAYQTAFLKANYPVEFMCALLTSESGNLDKTAIYVEECRRLNIDVLPPDVNSSCKDFTVEDKSIRFGMGAIKNVGEGPTETIVAEREENGPYKDIFDFCARLDTRQINRRLVESLNKAGAFSNTGWNRRQVDATIENALNEGQLSQKERAAGQTSLFDMEGLEETVQTMHTAPDLLEWPDSDLLQMEKEMLGLYISSHPLSPYESLLRRFSTLRVEELAERQDGEEVILGGVINTIKIHSTSRGKMAFLSLETLDGSCEVTIFSDTYEQKAGLITVDNIVMIDAKVNYRNSEAGLIANNIIPIEEAEKHFARAVHVHLSSAQQKATTAADLAQVLDQQRGDCELYLHCHQGDQREIIVHATNACMLKAGKPLQYAVEELLGEDSIFFSSGMGLPTHRAPKAIQKETPRWKKKKAASN